MGAAAYILAGKPAGDIFLRHGGDHHTSIEVEVSIGGFVNVFITRSEILLAHISLPLDDPGVQEAIEDWLMTLDIELMRG